MGLAGCAVRLAPAGGAGAYRALRSLHTPSPTARFCPSPTPPPSDSNFKVNFKALEKHGTVEFRHPGAVKEASTVGGSVWMGAVGCVRTGHLLSCNGLFLTQKASHRLSLIHLMGSPILCDDSLCPPAAPVVICRS